MTELEKITEKLWDMYIGRQDDITELLEYYDDNITVIGTGEWEYYRNKAEYAEYLKNERIKRDKSVYYKEFFHAVKRKSTKNPPPFTAALYCATKTIKT